MKTSIQVPNFYPTSSDDKIKATSKPESTEVQNKVAAESKPEVFPFRLDTITSQSEVDHSDDTDTEVCIKIQDVPKQPHSCKGIFGTWCILIMVQPWILLA